MAGKLQQYGTAGVASYGILNAVYYVSAFVIVFFTVGKAPSSLGFAGAAKRLAGILGIVYAGSQVR